ncbi:MAG: SOS response-associated peptidase [Leptospiraceae bacterium]|nr:SOS response-associated peptidase [Leptospiraceae bacterium]
MCGRFVRFAKESIFADLILRDGSPFLTEEHFAPRYNIAPGSPVEILRKDSGKYLSDFVLWGLLPAWSKDALQKRYSNARLEGIEEKPSFRGPYLRRRCLIQAEGYYEWMTKNKIKYPYYIYTSDLASFALGGIYDIWMGKDGSEEYTLALITTQANKSVSYIHDRMPLVIPKEHYESWLDPSLSSREIQKITDISKSNIWKSHQVSKEVNHSSANGSHLIQAMAEEVDKDPGLFDY